MLRRAATSMGCVHLPTNVGFPFGDPPVCEEPRCDSPMRPRAGVQPPDAYTRPHDGKIKEAPPHDGQAIDMAWPRAGASVGSRAARKRKMRFFRSHSGTPPI